jgi:hypothetical protein
MRERRRKQPRFAALWAFLAVLAAIVFSAYVRLRVADIPLERDEGEYAYAGQLILQGIPPYELVYNMKFPGTYYAYAAILALFGHTPWGIHVGLIFVNVASTVLVFAIGRRLLGDFAGATAGVTFAVLSLDRWIYGIFGHATHFVVLAALAGLWLLLRAVEDERGLWLFGSGVLLGFAVLMKQPAVFFLPLAALLVLWSDSRVAGLAGWDSVKRIGLMGLGFVLPMAVIVVELLVQGVWGRFWFWTIHYATAYASEVVLSKALPNLAKGFEVVTAVSLAFWIVAALGLPALWLGRWEPRARVFVTGLLVASFLAVCPGFYFRQHYFILLLPAVALLFGVAVSTLRELFGRVVPPVVAAALAVAVPVGAIGAYVTHERDFLFTMGTREVSRSIYAANPFIEAMEIGKYIRDRTEKTDRIAVLGSEPEIYFYADRKAATGYIYTYALMEPQPFALTMQQEMIREIESAHPLYLVFSWIDASWLARKESDQGIVAWGRAYVHQCYDPVGVADIVSENEAHIVWEESEVRKYVAASPNLIYTFRRKSDAPCTVAR